MSELPAGWEWARLEELAAPIDRAVTDGPFGSNLKSEHYTETGARVIRLQNIGDGFFRDERSYISLNHFDRLRSHEVRKGDLVVASLGENPPRACLIPELNAPAVVKADCIRIRLADSVDPRWVLYALVGPEGKKHAANLIKGVSRPRLGMSQIRQIPIPLPPAAEQGRVVATLEDHLSRLDAAERSIDSAQQRARMLWKSSMNGLLSAFDGFPIEPLSMLLREPLRNGHSGRATTSSSGVRTLTLTAVTKGQFSEEYTKLADVGRRRIDDFWLESGDIFIQRGNTPDLVGTSALYLGQEDWAIFPDLLIRIRTNEKVTPEYVHLVLSSTRVRNQLRNAAKGLAGSMPKIDQGAVAAVQIPVPELSDQNGVVERASFMQAGIERMEQELAKAMIRRQRLRRSLLVEAFTGRLVPQDPDDEPASLLLERIRAEQPKPKRTRRATEPPQEPLL
ncbi:MAG: restriction endonuclease subunit S [Gemmatimonadota bacterium]|nr:restriction endonuclease subunit S [Gemmatimonadota bacterium]